MTKVEFEKLSDTVSTDIIQKLNAKAPEKYKEIFTQVTKKSGDAEPFGLMAEFASNYSAWFSVAFIQEYMKRVVEVIVPFEE